MAEVLPFRAVHYELAAVPSLADVIAPPYDVIDAEQRRGLLARSPFNVAEIDLPEPPEDADPYEYAGQTMQSWLLEGILTADRDPAMWALEQDYEGPSGERLTRRGVLARVRLAEYGGGIRAHERTQPGPKEDRLRLTRATRHNLSPIFALHPGDAWRHLAPALDDPPWGEAAAADGTAVRLWRAGDEAACAAVAEELAGAELLIADGHHRYETALAYAAEVEGPGEHDFVLMCLVSIEDPGLTVFPTHRLVELDGAGRDRLEEGLGELFEVEEVPIGEIDPAGEEGIGVFGYAGAGREGALRLRLRDPGALDNRLDGRPEAYRRLDAVVLEALVLGDLLGMSEADVAAKRGIGYEPTVAAALAGVEGGDFGAAFILRPTPVEQVREVAGAGETMPPKSTYFFPKVPTGLAFNPLS